MRAWWRSDFADSQSDTGTCWSAPAPSPKSRPRTWISNAVSRDRGAAKALPDPASTSTLPATAIPRPATAAPARKPRRFTEEVIKMPFNDGDGATSPRQGGSARQSNASRRVGEQSPRRQHPHCQHGDHERRRRGRSSLAPTHEGVSRSMTALVQVERSCESGRNRHRQSRAFSGRRAATNPTDAGECGRSVRFRHRRFRGCGCWHRFCRYLALFGARGAAAPGTKVSAACSASSSIGPAFRVSRAGLLRHRDPRGVPLPAA